MTCCCIYAFIHVFLLTDYNIPDLQVPARKEDDSPPLVGGATDAIQPLVSRRSAEK